MIRRLVGAPQHLAALGVDADQPAFEEVDVLLMSGRLDDNRRRIAGPVAVGNMGLPNQIARAFIERDGCRFVSAGGADELVAVDERRFAIGPHRHRTSAKVLLEVLSPYFLSV